MANSSTTENHSNTPVELLADIESADWDDLTKPEGYVPWDNDLIAAANVALALGKPLLLTGDPGVGKSEFSRWLAHELERKGPGDTVKWEKFVVKSTTEASDLFYHYDTLGRFHDAHIAKFETENSLEHTESHNSGTNLPVVVNPMRYLTYQALGLSILYSVGKSHAEQKRWISSVMNEEFLIKLPDQPSRTVVLIDEIDKAPRDVPNDILDEIDKLTFSIREIGGGSIQADKAKRPVVVITSNSERDLPEPFLRRCIYYHIPFPRKDEHLKKIVLSRLGERMAESSPLLADVQKMLKFLRGGEITLHNQPGIAELLDWLYELTRERRFLASPLTEHPRAYIAAKTTLLKHSEDQKLASEENWKQWLTKAGL